MALSGQNGNGNGGANYYVNNGVVKKVEVAYNVANKFDADKIKDVELTVVLDAVKDNGEHFDKTIFISGNYKRDEMTNQIIDWGGAFVVRQFFNAAGLTNWATDDMGIIPESVTREVIGKTIYTISYRAEDNGEVKYKTYKMVAKNAEAIEKMFLKDVDGKYPPYKYAPHAVEVDPFVLVAEDSII